MGKRFGAMEIIPLWPKAGEEARRVIIRAIKDRKTSCRLHSGIILHDDNGHNTAAADNVLRGGAAIE
jgi:tRNA1(Val) A37 N6-methylase TrmN6